MTRRAVNYQKRIARGVCLTCPARVDRFQHCDRCREKRARARLTQRRRQAANKRVPRVVDHRCPELHDETLTGAFVAGAMWWEFTSTGGTMWASDRDKAWIAAADRYA